MANELNFGYASTGQTITAKLYTGGALVGTAISCPEVSGAGGMYSGSVPGGTAAATYQVMFYSSGTWVGSGVLFWNGTEEVTNLTLETDIAAVSGGGGGATIEEIVAALSGNQLEIVSPVITTNSATGLPVKIEVVQGADYKNADGTQLTLSLTGTFPDWTSATAYLDINCGGVALTLTGTITDATGTTRSVYFEMTSAQSATLTDADETRPDIVADEGWFDLRVVLATSGNKTKPVSRAKFIARRPA